MALTKVKSGMRTLGTGEVVTANINDGGVTTAKMAVDPTNASNLSSGDVPLTQLGNVPVTDLTGLEDDIALIGFKVAANGSLAKYNLLDQAIDAFEDDSGIDGSASTNDTRNASNYYSATATVGTVVAKTADGSWTSGASDTSIALLVVGGGGGGAAGGISGAGGAGGLVYISNYAVSPSTTYNLTVGSGGAGGPNARNDGANGVNTVFDTSATTLTITGNGGGGGGGGYGNGNAGAAGGSGGGSGGGDGGGPYGPANQPATFGSYSNVGFGNNGASAGGSSTKGGSGGGGAGAAGTMGGNGWGAIGGPGGAGKDYSSVFGTGYGASGWFAGGGGGGSYGGANGTGGQGGGGNQGNNGSANTGGGGGGEGDNTNPGNDGGSGIILIKPDDVYAGSMTLVSNATTAQGSPPTTGDLVITYTNGAGTADVNTDIKAYISRDGSAYTSAVTLASQGTTGGHTILTAHDVDLSGIASGTSMRWKIETLNQSVSKQTRIQAVSLGWS